MRTLKFRFWDKEQEVMLSQEDINVDYFKDIISYSEKHKVEIMQFTGLKDIKGREIFEGDIVKFPQYPEPNYILTVVMWDNETAGFGVYLKHRKKIVTFEQQLDKIEVVGNIWENKELLKSKKNEKEDN